MTVTRGAAGVVIDVTTGSQPPLFGKNPLKPLGAFRLQGDPNTLMSRKVARQ